jgi:hypothetical protein
VDLKVQSLWLTVQISKVILLIHYTTWFSIKLVLDVQKNLFCDIQGVSHWNDSFKLTDRNMQVRFCLKVFVYFWGLEIWVSSTSFQKINIGWPPISLQQKGYRISVILIFDDPFHKKWLLLVILVWLMIKPSGLGFFWSNMDVEAVQASEVAVATEVNEAAEVFKV